MTGSADVSYSVAEPDEKSTSEDLPGIDYGRRADSATAKCKLNGRHQRAWVLGRLHSEPLGVCVADMGCGGLTPDELGALLWSELNETITQRFASAGLPEPSSLTCDRLAANPDQSAVPEAPSGSVDRSAFHQEQESFLLYS